MQPLARKRLAHLELLFSTGSYNSAVVISGFSNTVYSYHYKVFLREQ
jgi:hypothetical protein